MSTYSIGTPPTNADKLANLQAIFNELPDNSTKSITPKNIRDAVYTLWETIFLKPTSIGVGPEYIGVDNVNLKEKIFIGNKQVNNSYVMTSDLLTSDADIFFYNTKADSLTNYDTKISILAGTQSLWNGSLILAPYLKSSRTDTPLGSYLDLTIGNDSIISGATYGGNININSSAGTVVINNVAMPTINQINYLSNSADGYVLKLRYHSGPTYGYVGPYYPYASWEAIGSQSGTAISLQSATLIGNTTSYGLNVWNNTVGVFNNNGTQQRALLSASGSLLLGQNTFGFATSSNFNMGIFSNGSGYSNNYLVYKQGTIFSYIQQSNLSANRTITFPDKSGMLALTTDIVGLTPSFGSVVSTGNTSSGTIYFVPSLIPTMKKVAIDSNGVVVGFDISGTYNNWDISMLSIATGSVNTYLQYRQNLGGVYTNQIKSATLSTNRTIYFPNNSGTVALLSDLSSLSPTYSVTGLVNQNIGSDTWTWIPGSGYRPSYKVEGTQIFLSGYLRIPGSGSPTSPIGAGLQPIIFLPVSAIPASPVWSSCMMTFNGSAEPITLPIYIDTSGNVYGYIPSTTVYAIEVWLDSINYRLN
jgi:hypothetical protein